LDIGELFREVFVLSLLLAAQIEHIFNFRIYFLQGYGALMAFLGLFGG
jgi:hypothetical protein